MRVLRGAEDSGWCSCITTSSAFSAEGCLVMIVSVPHALQVDSAGEAAKPQAEMPAASVAPAAVPPPVVPPPVVPPPAASAGDAAMGEEEEDADEELRLALQMSMAVRAPALSLLLSRDLCTGCSCSLMILAFPPLACSSCTMLASYSVDKAMQSLQLCLWACS